jgi:hypothetical protein
MKHLENPMLEIWAGVYARLAVQCRSERKRRKTFPLANTDRCGAFVIVEPEKLPLMISGA